MTDNRHRDFEFEDSLEGQSSKGNQPPEKDIDFHIQSGEVSSSGPVDDLHRVYSKDGDFSANVDRKSSQFEEMELENIGEEKSIEEVEQIAAKQNQQASTASGFELEKSVLDSKLESFSRSVDQVESPSPATNSLIQVGNAENQVEDPFTVSLPPKQPVGRNNSGELFRSFVWLATMVVFFLSIVSLGPSLLQKYRYAWTKGSQEAKYDVAIKTLPAVADSGHPIVSELVVHKVRPSVVSIEASVVKPGFGISKGQGSGVIVSADGLIVTNNHVVKDASRIWVTLSDRRELRAKIVGTDPHTDIAVIKVEASDLTPAEWGDSSSMELGSQVWAMGSPFGLEQTVTKGILSGKHRAVSEGDDEPKNHFQDLLQTDAAINPGNSGGPLVNSKGEIIGINVSIYGKFFQGISFAVPSTLAKEIVEKLIKYGRVERGFLGIEIQDVKYRDQVRYGLEKISGAKVKRVNRNSAAAKAGIRRNDVITKIAGEPIENTVMLFRQIGLQAPGSEIPLEVIRDGKKMTIYATMADRSEVEERDFTPRFRRQ